MSAIRSLKILLVMAVIALPIYCLAAVPDYVDGGPTSIGPEGGEKSLVSKIITFALSLAAIIALIMIIYSGFVMMTAAGNKERFAKGTKGLILAITGLAIALMAYTILFIVSDILI